jgi:hypothetical protein
LCYFIRQKVEVGKLKSQGQQVQIQNLPAKKDPKKGGVKKTTTVVEVVVAVEVFLFSVCFIGSS